MKILGSDFDGTLSDGGIDDRKRKAIVKWRQAGNIFALVSGRNLDNLTYLPEKYSFEYDYLIGNNGAVVVKKDGTVIFSAKCEGKLALPLITHLIESGCSDIYVATEFRCRVFSDENDCDDEGKYTLNTLPEIPWFTQICTYCPSYEIAKKVSDDVRETFVGALNPLQNGRNVDIVRADVNKAKGVEFLMNLCGVEKRDVIVAGNGENDVDMLAAFHSYAMENSVDSVKQIANHTIESVTSLIEREMASLSGNL